MEIFGYVAAILIGISLGLIGGGGSILTVPVLVYLFDTDPLVATYYSLFIVGSTSLIGAFKNYLRKQVNVKIAMLFGLSSILTVILTRRYLLPAIPNTIMDINGFVITKSLLTMVLFSILMVFASLSMIRSGNSKKPETEPKENKAVFVRLMIYGMAIGLVTGLLGAGGGFLLIPALVLLVGLPIKEAIGTSLLIIAMNSLIGFAGDLGAATIQWKFLLTIAGIAIGGVLIGTWLGNFIPGAKLKKGFGWFVLITGIYILLKEVFFKH